MFLMLPIFCAVPLNLLLKYIKLKKIWVIQDGQLPQIPTLRRDRVTEKAPVISAKGITPEYLPK
jgi:hypothetical protein